MQTACALTQDVFIVLLNVSKCRLQLEIAGLSLQFMAVRRKFPLLLFVY